MILDSLSLWSKGFNFHFSSCSYQTWNYRTDGLDNLIQSPNCTHDKDYKAKKRWSLDYKLAFL